MAGSFKTEAVVLRSIRYGEADRILHLYSRDRGRVNAITKGARRPKSRFGGRLEPFFRLRLVLYKGRGDLMTVTAADTVAAHANLRSDGAALMEASRGCDAVLRLLDSGEANVPAYNLLCRYLAFLDEGVEEGRMRHHALSFRLKLALAAGFAPELASCARCGVSGEELTVAGFSGSAGGVVCDGCQAGAFDLGPEAHGFLVGALGAPLAAAPDGSEIALRQAERAINETLEHHAHVRLKAA